MKLYKLYEWIRSFFKKSEKWKIINVEETPKRLKGRTIYMEQNAGLCWQMLMLCPCGCKTILYLNALGEYKPSWRLTSDKKGEIFIHPSIHRQEGCCSHFFIKNSQVLWV